MRRGVDFHPTFSSLTKEKIMIYRWKAENSNEEIIKEKIAGFIDIEIPKSEERMLLLKEVNLKFENGKAAFNLDQIETMIKISRMVKERIKNVSIKFGENEITDFDTIEFYNFHQTIVNELSSILFSGIPMGN